MFILGVGVTETETARRIIKGAKDDLSRLTMDLINALGMWAQAVEKRLKEQGRER